MAKEAIYTIPLWDAVRSDNECPFCFIEGKLEKDIIDFCLSDAYMESDFRQTTNKIGFCNSHFTKLYASNNKLGLLLVNQSHMMEMMQSFETVIKNASHPRKSLFKKNDVELSPVEKLHHTLKHDCYICQRIETTMTRYFDTFFHLFKTDKSFASHLLTTKGFCMTHYLSLIDHGQKHSSQAVYDEFIQSTLPLFRDNMNRVLEDMQWFANKYDYRYEDQPWKNAKDAPKRSLQKINGTLVE